MLVSEYERVSDLPATSEYFQGVSLLMINICLNAWWTKSLIHMCLLKKALLTAVVTKLSIDIQKIFLSLGKSRLSAIFTLVIRYAFSTS